VHHTFESLIELIEGAVSDTTRRHLEEHLAACGTCRERMQEIRRVLEALASDRLIEPSGASIDIALRALHPMAVVEPPRWAKGLPERLARVVFDSFVNPQQAFAGARTVSIARRLRFEIDQIELDALVEVEGDSRRLTGQVLSLSETPEPVEGAPFSVLAAGAVVAEGETSSHGEIVMESAPAGEFEIRLGAKGRVYVFGVSDPKASAPER
jgi:anti-sigma factor RsiW